MTENTASRQQRSDDPLTAMLQNYILKSSMLRDGPVVDSDGTPYWVDPSGCVIVSALAFAIIEYRDYVHRDQDTEAIDDRLCMALGVIR